MQFSNSPGPMRILLSLCFLPALVSNLHAELLEVAPQVKIFYESTGEGQVLVFIPGWTMTSGIWKEQVTNFSKTYRVITIDPRSHGNSSKTVAGNSLQQHAKDLRKLIEELNLNNVTLIGWSMGVATILEYVNLYDNDRLKALILVDGSPCMLKKEDWPYGMSADEAYKTLMGFENQRSVQTNQYVDSLFKTDRQDSELDWIVNEAMRTPTSVSTVLAYDYFYLDRRPLLSKITVPTLLIMTGENESVGEYMKGAIPNSELSIFDGLGQAIFLEDPKKFNERLAAFLKSAP
jgi:non-heme chloroperoxidase